MAINLSQVEVLAEVGDWFKVRWHKRTKDKTQKDPTSSSSSPGGDAATPSVDPSADSGKSTSDRATAGADGDGGEESSEAGEADDAEDDADAEAGKD